jgi:hypothetical protein
MDEKDTREDPTRQPAPDGPGTEAAVNAPKKQDELREGDVGPDDRLDEGDLSGDVPSGGE